MKIRAAIVEDEPYARDALRGFLSAEPDFEIVGEAWDGLAAVRLVDDLKPDVVFLDVRLPELSGIDVLARARFQPKTVFTSAFDAYAVTAFELGAVDYLVKPFGRDRFRKAIRRLVATEPAGDEGAAVPKVADRLRTASARGWLSRFFVRDGPRVVGLDADAIVLVEAQDDYIAICAGPKTYLVHLTLREFEKKLDPARFRRVHRSLIVNLRHVTSIERGGRRLVLVLSNGTRVHASRSRSSSLREGFL